MAHGGDVECTDGDPAQAAVSLEGKQLLSAELDFGHLFLMPVPAGHGAASHVPACPGRLGGTSSSIDHGFLSVCWDPSGGVGAGRLATSVFKPERRSVFLHPLP